ncbi:MAG: DUF362 domain-containing protein [Thermodesulfobacteriota bacterium]
MAKGVGLHNQDPPAPVALVEWKDDGTAVAEALAAAEAFKHFDPHMSVLVKPNLVEWLTKFEFAPYGIVTTAAVIEALIRCLKDAGARDVTIAEAAVDNEEFGCSTTKTYQAMGLDKLSARYGVKLVDLNDEEFVKTGLGGFSLSVARRVLEADFVINLPVLKTHEQTRVTLGFKNSKGCLNGRSKSICHHRQRPLDDFVARLGARLYPHLTLIDGIYSLEYGPMHMGTAHRENLILAGRDMFNCDVVGAGLMGFDPAEVGHLAAFAAGQNRSLKIEDIEVRGLNPAGRVHKLKHFDDQDPWYTGSDQPGFFTRAGVKGFRLPHPGQTLCTGCSMLFPVSVLLIIAGAIISGGQPYDDYELLGGKNTKPSGTAKKTFLLGDCIIAANRRGEGIREAVAIPGCPASLEELVGIFQAHGINGDLNVLTYYFHKKVKSYVKKGEAFQPRHFTVP